MFCSITKCHHVHVPWTQQKTHLVYGSKARSGNLDKYKTQVQLNWLLSYPLETSLVKLTSFDVF